MKNFFAVIILIFIISPKFVFSQICTTSSKDFEIPSSILAGEINKIVIDKSGIAWFATTNGLIKFNSYTYKYYRSELNSDNALSHNQVYDLKFAKGDSLWIATYNGLNLFNTSKGTFKYIKFFVNNTQLFVPIFKIIPYKNEIYLTTSIPGLFKLNHKNSSIVPVEGLNQNILSVLSGTVFSDIAVYNDKLVLVSSKSVYFFDKNAGILQNIELNGNDEISCIDSDNAHLLIAGTKSGKILSYRNNEFMIVDKSSFSDELNSFEKTIISDIKIINSNSFLVATTANGIFKYTDHKLIEPIQFCEEVKNAWNSERIKSITIEDNILWIAKNNASFSVIRMDESLLRGKTDVSSILKFPEKVITSIFIDSKKQIWLSIENEGVFVVKDITQLGGSFSNKVSILDPSKYGKINKIVEGKDHFWFLTDKNGIVVYNTENNSVRQYTQGIVSGLISNSIITIFCDNQNSIWVITHDGIVQKFNPNSNKFEIIELKTDKPEFISGCKVRDMVQDKESNCWFSGSCGVIRFDLKSKTFEHYLMSDNNFMISSESDINCIFSDSNGKIWIGNHSGLKFFNKKENKFEDFKIMHDNFNLGILDIFESNDNFLWGATNSHLIKINKENGLVNSICIDYNISPHKSGLSSFQIIDSLNLLALSNKGVVNINLNNLQDNENEGKICISDIKVFDQSLFEKENFPFSLEIDSTGTYKVLLRYTSNVITFEFTDLNFLSENHHEYEYFLEGYDNTWINARGNNSATYSKLSGGHYIFHVKILGHSGNDSEQIVYLTIEPPFWQTIWFWSIIFILVLLSIYFIYNSRISRVSRIRHVLEKQVSDRTKALESKNEEIKAQKEMLLNQRDIANKQNAQIANQKIELEKQQALLEEIVLKRNSELETSKKLYEGIVADCKASESKFSLFNGLSKDFIFRLKFPEEIFEVVSKSASDLTGYSMDEFKNNPTMFNNLFAPDYKDIYKTIRKNINSPNLDKDYQFKLQRKNEEQIWVSMHINILFDENQNATAIEGIIIDISKQLRNESTLRAKKQRIDESNKLKTAFISNMSHDLRTPINTIVGFADLLSDPDISFDEKEVFVQHINSSSNSLLHFVDDFIDLSKIESGQLEISKSQCYINKILLELESSFRTVKENAGKKDVELVLNLAVSEENFSFYTDTYRIRQILMNLVGNALKYTDKGKIEFGYKLDVDNESGSTEADSITFYVKDTGIGISEEKQKHLFTRSTEFKENNQNLNNGLGLVISKKLVELLGGDLEVESNEGYGSYFKFTLPIEKQKGFKVIETPVEVKQDFEWSSKTILVAEDEENNFKFIQAALKKTNAKLIWAKDGVEALEKFNENLKQIDIILMDIQMPRMNGYDATKAAKKIDPNVPIIAQTAFAMSGSKIKCFDSGCDDYIAKPYKAKDLLEIISEHI